MEGTIYSYDVRVLACASCGAPLPVPVPGGTVACDYCSYQNVVVARQIGAEAKAKVLSEEQRVAELRKQHGRPYVLPAAVQWLMDGSDFHADRVQDGLKLFSELREQLTRGPNEDAERQLTALVEIFSNHYWREGEHMRLRAICESGLEARRDPRNRQMVRANLASTAARVGELDAARTWLAQCDPASNDIDADSAYRLARAVVSTCAGDFQDVLTTLGGRLGDVPLSGEVTELAVLFRANALERVVGVEAAIEELARVAASSQLSWLYVSLSRHKRRDMGQLCPESFEQARPRVAWSRRVWYGLPLKVTVVYAAILGPLLCMGLYPLVTPGAETHYGMLGTAVVLLALGAWLLPALVRQSANLRPERN